MQDPSKPHHDAASATTVAVGDASRASDTFATFYADHFAFVWRSLRRLGVDAAQLDDAAQNVFVVVYRRLETFEHRASPRTWLFRIAMNVARDVRRTHRRKGGAEPLPETLCDTAPNPQQQAERAQALAVLERFLESLDEDKRAVFVLAEMEQMTLPEVADALGVNINTVGSRLRAARAAFEKEVARQQKRSTR